MANTSNIRNDIAEYFDGSPSNIGAPGVAYALIRNIVLGILVQDYCSGNIVLGIGSGILFWEYWFRNIVGEYWFRNSGSGLSQELLSQGILRRNASGILLGNSAGEYCPGNIGSGILVQEYCVRDIAWERCSGNCCGILPQEYCLGDNASEYWFRKIGFGILVPEYWLRNIASAMLLRNYWLRTKIFCTEAQVNTMIIKYVSAPSGGGKTHKIIARACKLAQEHERVMILQPTKELINKTVGEELLARTNPPRYRMFHQDTVVGKSVAGELTKFFNEPDDFVQIVFATHQVLPYIPFIANKSDWHLLIDEEMQVLRYRCHRIPKTHSLITDHVDLEPYNAIYSRVAVRNRSSLENLAENRDKDEILEILADTIRALTNRHWRTYANTEQYQRLQREEVKLLAFHSMLDPKIIQGFGSVFMAAANFEDTAIYKLWSPTHRFEKDQEFCEFLRFQTHTNGHLITIQYVTEDQWSRKRLNSLNAPDDQPNGWQRIIQAIKDTAGDDPFLWQANKSMHENPFGTKGTRLPNKPHGLNRYSDTHNIAFLSALNPPTDHFRFLDTEGLSGADVRAAIYFQTAYQSIMRTSIRDPENHQSKKVIVPDRGLAEYLHSLFPGSRTERLDIGIEPIEPTKTGRPKKYLSNRERVADQRRRGKEIRDSAPERIACFPKNSGFYGNLLGDRKRKERPC